MSEAFCTGCGSALAPGAAFCGSCGAPTDARVRTASQPDVPTSAPAPVSQVAEPQAPPRVYDPPPVQPAAVPYNAPPPAPAYPSPPYSAPPVAPSYATPPPFQGGAYAQPSLATDPTNEPLARAYIGPNADYYLGKWRMIGAAGKPNSWNWAAFLLNAWWLVYRRMWTPAMGALAAIFVLNMASVFMPGARALTSGLTLGICALIGWRGNAMYRDHTDRAIAQSGAIAPDPNSRMAWLQTQGGVGMPAAVGVGVGFALAWYAVLFLIISQGGFGSRRSSYGSFSYSSAASPSSSGSGLITDEFLQGAQWAVNCIGPGAYIRLNPDKTFTASVGAGTWSQLVGVLTLRYNNGQPPETMSLTMRGPNQISFTEANRVGTLNRC